MKTNAIKNVAADMGLDLAAHQIEVSASRNGAAGAVTWSNSPDALAAIAALKARCAATGFVVVGETPVGFSICHPSEASAVRASHWERQRPIWKG